MHFFPAVESGPVERSVATMSSSVITRYRADQVFPQRACPIAPLHNPRALREGDNLVGPDAELPLAGGCITLEELVDKDKYLLHHCILTEVIPALIYKHTPTIILYSTSEYLQKLCDIVHMHINFPTVHDMMD